MLWKSTFYLVTHTVLSAIFQMNLVSWLIALLIIGDNNNNNNNNNNQVKSSQVKSPLIKTSDNRTSKHANS